MPDYVSEGGTWKLKETGPKKPVAKVVAPTPVPEKPQPQQQPTATASVKKKVTRKRKKTV